MALIGVREPISSSGSQFEVFKQTMAYSSSPSFVAPRVVSNDTFYAEDVAVKQPRIFLQADSELDLAAPEVQEHVHHMCLEIQALSHPVLRNHQNVVNLLGWSWEHESWHHSPLLLVELALFDLGHLLETRADLSIAARYSLCCDVGAGLDAVHECRLVHGDLKPQNILIFEKNGTLVAKLADFGLAIDEVSEDASSLLAGTPGWQAPEVENRRVLLHLLPATDVYSYGVLLASVMLYSGHIPPSRDRFPSILEAMNLQRNDLTEPLYHCLRFSLPQLLHHEATARPALIVDCLNSINETKVQR
jgi:serine/threonine protein kinase